MGIIQRANLPTKKVSNVLISYKATKALLTLKSLGINVLLMNNNPIFDNPVQSHPDMSFLHIFKKECFINSNVNNIDKILTNIGYNVNKAKNVYGSKYPNDVGLNCAVVGNCLIGREASIDVAVKEFCYNNGFEIINVNQGYSKCSICIVDEHSIITEDDSIYNTLKNKFDVLKIQSGYVGLNGYNYGFFGGCTGLIDKNVLAINGDINLHKDKNSILDFLKERRIQILKLKGGYLEDIGSIIPLTE